MENQIQGRGNEISWSQFSGIPLNCGILSEGKFLTMAKNLDNIAQVRHDDHSGQMHSNSRHF